MPTLDNCEREPIHIPGSIQPHGGLIAFEAVGGTIVHASVNLGRWLPVGNLPVKGRSVADLVGLEDYESLLKPLSEHASGPVRHQIVELLARPAQGRPEALRVLMHQHRNMCYAEMEPMSDTAASGDWLQSLSDTVDALRSADSLDDLCERMARRIKRATGMDRVMVYRFDADHHGHVIADAREPGMPSFFDLHYPASDIPTQARDLYLRNLVRYIPDVDYVPVEVLPWVDSATLQLLDMSHAVLRSVSPIHLRYLRNMGVASTLTLSLLVDGKLWGLIACHHRTPTRISLPLRRACYALAITAGFMTGWFAGQQRQTDVARRTQSLSSILRAFNHVQATLPEVMEACAVALRDLPGSIGGAFWLGDVVIPFGQWPDAPRAASILHYARYAFEAAQTEMLFTDALELTPPLGPAELRSVCGLAAIKFEGFTSAGVVWLRGEHRRDVTWGGDPDKPVQVEIDVQGRAVLSPRSSFAAWNLLVTGRCRPWSPLDREAVASIGALGQVLAVRESLAQVSLSDRQFRSLVALQSDAYWQTDQPGRVVTLSRQLPFEHGRLTSRRLVDVFADVCAAEGVDALREAFDSGRSFRGLRLTGGRPGDAAAFVVQISGEPTKDADGMPSGWHGTLSDVTHELQVETALRQKAAAELTSLTKSKFISQVSHELRTPLNAVLGFSQLMLTDPATSTGQRDQVEQIHKAGQWLLTMIDDLLDLSRIESGNPVVSLGPIDLPALVDAVARLIGPQARDHGVRLTLPAVGPALAVRADPARLRQVLLNLLSNAVKYNRSPGEVRVHFDTSAEGLVRIDIIDVGEGLSPAQLAHLFEPFNRLGREGMSIGGTGIGLVISRQLVELMKGSIEVESHVGMGSRFSVTLPRAEPVVREADERLSDAFALAVLPIDAGPVLYVEDDEVNELLMRSMVQGRLKLPYATVGTAEEAVRLARVLKPAVMLVDLNLPDHSGLWVAAEVRKDPGLQSVRLISVSADATPETQAELLAGGFDERWSKPLDMRRVARRLNALFGGDSG